MRRAITLLVIFFVTSVVAIVATPSGDPYIYYITHAVTVHGVSYSVDIKR